MFFILISEISGALSNFAVEASAPPPSPCPSPASGHGSFPGKARKRFPHHAPQTCPALGSWATVSQGKFFLKDHWWWEEAFLNSLCFDTFTCLWDTSGSLWPVSNFPGGVMESADPHGPMGRDLSCWVCTFPNWKVRFLKSPNEGPEDWKYTLHT